MANLQGPTYLRTADSVLVQYGFYRFITTAATPLFIHMKTNIPKATNIMSMIEAIGYNYGASTPFMCAWCFYTYGDGNLYNVGYGSIGSSGLQAVSVYQSSDNYAVIVAGAPSALNYTGFTLDAYQTAGNGRGHKVSILAAVQTSSSGAYY